MKSRLDIIACNVPAARIGNIPRRKRDYRQEQNCPRLIVAIRTGYDRALIQRKSTQLGNLHVFLLVVFRMWNDPLTRFWRASYAPILTAVINDSLFVLTSHCAVWSSNWYEIVSKLVTTRSSAIAEIASVGDGYAIQGIQGNWFWYTNRNSYTTSYQWIILIYVRSFTIFPVFAKYWPN